MPRPIKFRSVFDLEDVWPDWLRTIYGNYFTSRAWANFPEAFSVISTQVNAVIGSFWSQEKLR